MGKFVAGNGQYVVYAKDGQEAREILLHELERVDKIKEKMVNLLTKDGLAYKNFIANTNEEKLSIEFDDENSLLFDDPNNANDKGIVRTRSSNNGEFTYELAYRYPEIQGHNADFRLAHEMGHLMLNPSNGDRQTYDEQTNTRLVTGLIRVAKGEENNRNAFYGEEMQENAINLLAQLAIRGEHSADDIITGKADVSEFNLYKKCDDLVKLLAVSMRNDFEKEMSFEQLVNNKIDSFIEHSDGTKEPANTFLYGILNDSSMIENEFDKYAGKGAWRQINDSFAELYNRNISQDRFEAVFQVTQDLIQEFANARFKDKYKEAIARNRNLNIPNLENKLKMIKDITGLESRETQIVNEEKFGMTDGVSINEYGEVIRPDGKDNSFQIDNNIPTFEPPSEKSLSFKQKIAMMLQNNDFLMKILFLRNLVDKQLNVLPPPTQNTSLHGGIINRSRVDFMNEITNFGQYRNLPPIRRMSDPERIMQMQRKMEENQKSTDENERS